MCSTDHLGLSEQKIFKEACAVLPKIRNKPLNLVAVRDSVLFTWDFSNNCVLSLNVKATRGKEGDKVFHQKLVPLHPPLFTPEFLVANESGTLLAVAGSNGVLVFQLPPRCPPYGTFDGNKELVYCRSHSLDERLLSCSENIEVRKVKFHPGSVSDSHILVLTSDNVLRLYQILNNEALIVDRYPVGEKPGGMFPGTRTTFLDIYGEAAVDFDFGLPEIVETVEQVHGRHPKFLEVKKESPSSNKPKSVTITPKRLEKPKTVKNQYQHDELVWPIYILRGDFSVFSICIDLNKRTKAVLRGPCPFSEQPESIDNDACSIICLKTTPQIVCIASSTGLVIHSILFNRPEDEEDVLKVTTKYEKELVVFEAVELELGLALPEEVSDVEGAKYKCPVFLHNDDSKVSRYFATHSAGVHTININCTEELHSYVFGPDDEDPTMDIFNIPSSAEYLVCTKTSSSSKSNPVIGFSLYYEPTSVITLLSDASVVTVGILTAAIPPKERDPLLEKDTINSDVPSPLKKMLNEPFDQYIQNILKKGVSRPLLKLPSTSNVTPEEFYELICITGQALREEHFMNYAKAGEELEKRARTLSLLKQTQKKYIEQITDSKEDLRLKAECLAEKYEDIKDKQEELLKRCEQLLMLVARKKPEPSDAENKFVKDLQRFSEKCASFQTSMDKLKQKRKYQEIQIQNWKARENKKLPVIGEMQSKTIKDSLKESTLRINDMIKQVNEYRSLLNLN